jgi:signal peptidase I
MDEPPRRIETDAPIDPATPVDHASPESPEQQQPPAAPEKKKKHGPASFFKELPLLILIAFGLALLIKTFLIQAFFIPSESMVPTLQVGDRVLVNKLVYRFHEPRRGDVIVFIEHAGPKKSFGARLKSFFTEGLGVTRPEQRDFIKRVIALPGETIEVKSGTVLITPVRGSRFSLSEPYVNKEKDTSSYGPYKVPKGTYFVMGDNRTNSADSRTKLGPIKRADVVGRAFVRIWPLGRFGFFHRPHYTQARGASAPASLIPLPVLAWGAVRRRRPAA